MRSIEIEADLVEKQPKLEYLLSTFTFSCQGKPDFIHTPKSKGPSWFIAHGVSGVPGTPDSPEFVLADRGFYAPAVIVQKAGLFAALVPDLDLINRLKVLSPDARPSITTFAPTPVDRANNSMPTALDYTLTSGLTARPLLAYGLIDFVPVHHMRWRHTSDGKMVRTLASSRVGYGFDLFLSADAEPYRGFQQVARYQWRRYGSPLLAKPRPQAMPFVEYLKVIYPACLGWNHNHGFAEFEMQGRQVGGWYLAAPFWPYVLSNGPWWNNPRDAVGMYLSGATHQRREAPGSARAGSSTWPCLRRGPAACSPASTTWIAKSGSRESSSLRSGPRRTPRSGPSMPPTSGRGPITPPAVASREYTSCATIASARRTSGSWPSCVPMATSCCGISTRGARSRCSSPRRAGPATSCPTTAKAAPTSGSSANCMPPPRTGATWRGRRKWPII